MEDKRKGKQARLSRRQALAAGGAFLGAAAAGFPAWRSAQAAEILQMGSASLGSTGYVIVETLSAIVNKFSDPKLRTSSMSTGGGAENMALVGQGLIDFGQTTSADWHPALNGLPPYPDPVQAHQMFSYMVWTPVPIVRASSDIRSLDDLAGKRISTGSAGGSATRLWKTLLDSAGLLDRVEFVSTGGWRGTYDAFRQEAIDCTTAILTTGKPSPLVTELESTVKLRVLDVPADLLARANERNRGVLSFELTPELWATLSQPTKVPAYAGILAAHPRITAETGYNITKAIYDHAEDARKASKLMSNITIEFATKYMMAGIPVNAGAAQYFKEQGVWRDDLDIAS